MGFDPVGRYRLSRCFAYVFADHYLTNWWSLGNHAGTQAFSYILPPLIHHLNAILGSLIGVDLPLLYCLGCSHGLPAGLSLQPTTGRLVASYAAFIALLPPLLIYTLLDNFPPGSTLLVPACTPQIS
jgi:hypothetical protein